MSVITPMRSLWSRGNSQTPDPILFTDDFESGALGDAGRWQDIVNPSAFSIVTTAAEGIAAAPSGGAQVMKVQNPGGAISHFVSTAPTSPYERLRLTYSLYRSSAYEAANAVGARLGGVRGSTTQFGSFGVGFGTSGSCPDDPANVHAQEFMYSYAFNDTNTFALRIYTEWLNQTKLTVSPPTCGGNYAQTGSPTASYNDLSFVPSHDAWHKYAVEVQLNTVGIADGHTRVWVDDILRIDHSSVLYRTTPGMKLWGVTFDSGNVAGGTNAAYYVDAVEVRGV